MEKELLFAIISSIFILVGIVPLWRDMLKKRTIPHPVTTWVWIILVWLNLSVLFDSREYYWLIPAGLMLLTLIGETVTWVIFLKKIYINWFDWLCWWLAIATIIYFLYSKNITHTVIFTALIDFIATLPTFKKSWLQPWTETAFNYFIGWFGQLFILLALEAPDFDTSLFWWYIFFIDTALVLLILGRRYSLKWWKSIFM